jgi:hypothetical protein
MSAFRCRSLWWRTFATPYPWRGWPWGAEAVKSFIDTAPAIAAEEGKWRELRASIQGRSAETPWRSGYNEARAPTGRSAQISVISCAVGSAPCKSGNSMWRRQSTRSPRRPGRKPPCSDSALICVKRAEDSFSAALCRIIWFRDCHPWYPWLHRTPATQPGFRRGGPPSGRIGRGCIARRGPAAPRYRDGSRQPRVDRSIAHALPKHNHTHRTLCCAIRENLFGPVAPCSSPGVIDPRFRRW